MKPRKLIRDTYNLTDEQSDDALGYINAHREAVKAEYELVLRQEAEMRAYWEERIGIAIRDRRMVETL